MTTFIYALMGFLIFFTACYLLHPVDDEDTGICNQCKTEECMPDCEHHEWRTG